MIAQFLLFRLNIDTSQGLNNPNSNKEVSKELMPILNQLFASRAPEYHNTAVTPVDERYGILMFGNVSSLNPLVVSQIARHETETALSIIPG